jgi:hypothetical protein
MRIHAAYNNTSEIELEGTTSSDVQTIESSSLFPIGTKVAKQFDGTDGELVWFEGAVQRYDMQDDFTEYSTLTVTVKRWTLMKYVVQLTIIECTYSHKKRLLQKQRLLQLAALCCPPLSMLRKLHRCMQWALLHLQLCRLQLTGHTVLLHRS